MDERKLKKLFDSRLRREVTHVTQLSYGIFGIGFVCGLVFAYTSVIQMVVGILIGFAIHSTSNGEFIGNIVLVWTSSALNKGINILRFFNHSYEKEE